MKKIIITRPDFFATEAQQINALLAEENIRLHLRKPDATEVEYKKLLQQIDTKFYTKIVLHDFFHLQKEYAVGGFHFSTKKRGEFDFATLPHCDTATLTKSTSCHSVEELQLIDGQYDYAFLSPIFPSISKPDYQGCLNLQKVQAYLQQPHCTQIVALGGIDSSKITQIRAWGFDGYAMLGAVWQ